MKKEHVFIPEPRSSFRKIECNECKEMQIVYSHVTSETMCNTCGNTLAIPRGSKARLLGSDVGSAE